MNMNGNLPLRNSSDQSLNRSIPLVLEMFLVVMGGALATYLHFKLRIPLNIPGHHGLEFMAIIALIRMSSGIRYAGLLAMLGTGIMLLIPGIGQGTLLHGFSYLIPGLILDLFYLAGKDRIRILLVISLASGLAYMCIPLSRLIVNLAFGHPYMAFVKYGVAYTTLSFFFYGMLGGILGYGLFNIKNSILRSKDDE